MNPISNVANSKFKSLGKIISRNTNDEVFIGKSAQFGHVFRAKSSQLTKPCGFLRFCSTLPDKIFLKVNVIGGCQRRAKLKKIAG